MRNVIAKKKIQLGGSFPYGAGYIEKLLSADKHTLFQSTVGCSCLLVRNNRKAWGTQVNCRVLIFRQILTWVVLVPIPGSSILFFLLEKSQACYKIIKMVTLSCQAWKAPWVFN